MEPQSSRRSSVERRLSVGKRGSAAWISTVAMLNRRSAAGRASGAFLLQGSYDDVDSAALCDKMAVGNAVIRLLDKPSQRTLLVSWSDPQGGNYGSQVWRLSIAKRVGTCALSGKTIAKGDAMYRPAHHAVLPINHLAMISIAGVRSMDCCGGPEATRQRD